jgi:ZIP family zinc transporter
MLEALNLRDQNPILLALCGGIFTWFVTGLGAATVFLRKEFSKRVLCLMYGFAAGVMIAASFWSLLAPAIEIAGEMAVPAWLPAVVGFMLGAGFLRVADMALPHLHPGLRLADAEGPHVSWQRSTLLVLAITLHNIPEGLAIGVAFGAATSGEEFALGATIPAAIALTVGIGLQNFPEGIAVSVPLRHHGLSRRKCFMAGQLSGVVEPFAAVLGAAVVFYVTPVLPYALAFAAGAMIYVVVEELIPEAHQTENPDLSTVGVILGFTVMMTLDVALG